MRKHPASIVASLALVIITPAAMQGCQTQRPNSQSALNTLERREVNASASAAFDAAVATFGDLHYTIRTAYKNQGYLSGFNGPSLVVINFEELGPANTAVRVTTSQNGQTQSDKPLIDSIFVGINRHLAGTN